MTITKARGLYTHSTQTYCRTSLTICHVAGRVSLLIHRAVAAMTSGDLATQIDSLPDTLATTSSQLKAGHGLFIHSLMTTSRPEMQHCHKPCLH